MTRFNEGDIVRDKVNGDKWRVDEVSTVGALEICSVTGVEGPGYGKVFPQVVLGERYELYNGEEPDTIESIRQRVIDLWLGNDCWIPGMDYERLADALGVDPSRLENDRTRRFHEYQASKEERR